MDGGNETRDGFNGFRYEIEVETGLKDPMVLLFLVLCWTCFGLNFLRRVRLKSVISGEGLLVLGSETKEWEDMPSHFIYDVRYQLADGSTTLSKKGHVSELKQQVQNHIKLHHTVVKTHRVRSFEKFCEGGMDPKLGAPPPPMGPFQAGYRTKYRFAIYRNLTKSALKNCSIFIIACGLLGASCMWLLRTADTLGLKLGMEYLLSKSAVKMNFKAAHEVHKVMLPLASFILALYINQKLSWFFQIVGNAWGVQGKLHDLALTGGASLLPHSDPVIRKARWALYRYLNLVHIFLYQSIGMRYKTIEVSDLLRTGLITKEESVLLEKGESNKRLQVISWIVTLMRELHKNGKIEKVVLHEALVSLKEVRGGSSALVKELTKIPPMSFAQLMQLMIDMLLLLTAPSMAFIFDTDKDSYTIYAWPAFAATVISLFYQGGMRIITAMEYPFGSRIDHLDPDWLLMASERAMYEFLTCSAPESILHKDLDGCVDIEGEAEGKGGPLAEDDR